MMQPLQLCTHVPGCLVVWEAQGRGDSRCPVPMGRDEQVKQTLEWLPSALLAVAVWLH